jgi:hypothetical protein
MPMLVILYLVAYIDKANIGNAKIEGLLEDLSMTGDQYNIALSIYFIPCQYATSIVSELGLMIYCRHFGRSA